MADAATGLVCTPNASTCEAGVLSTCDAEGSASTESTCTLGCFDDTRCNKLDPSNGLASHLNMAASATDLVLTGAATIDTSNELISDETGALVVSTAVVSGGPVEIFVLRVKSLTAGSISVTGTRALAIVSDGDILLNGGLDSSAVILTADSPGGIGDTATCGNRDAAGSGESWPGGGGGGYGGTGGSGGLVPGHNGGVGSPPNGSPSIVPLRGGCAGGVAVLQSAPGSGGGALQLVSNSSIVVAPTGHIAANGAGAFGSAALVTCAGSPCHAGDGGGSGGAIPLEAPSVTLAPGAGLFANGGGGSCSVFTTTGSDLASGENGQLSETRAAGGVCTGTNVGNGGAGGAGATANASSGLGSSLTSDMDGGGGGGGVGRIRINLPLGAATTNIEGTISPASSFGALGAR